MKRIRKDIVMIENITVTTDNNSKVIRFSKTIKPGFYDMILIPK